MNWTASLLRNQLKKERESYEARLILLTSNSVDAENYLALEAEKEQLAKDLQQIQTTLTNLQTDYSNLVAKEQVVSCQRDSLEKDLKVLETKHHQEITAKDKELRDYQAYQQREIKRIKKDCRTELSNKTQKLRDEISDQQRELKLRSKLITNLQEQTTLQKKELEFANSKIKHLQPLFDNLLQAVKKATFLTGKKELKETISQIEQLMEWERSPLTETPNTPFNED